MSESVLMLICCAVHVELREIRIVSPPGVDCAALTAACTLVWLQPLLGAPTVRTAAADWPALAARTSSPIKAGRSRVDGR
jgi:hypothetical protein